MENLLVWRRIKSLEMFLIIIKEKKTINLNMMKLMNKIKKNLIMKINKTK